MTGRLELHGPLFFTVMVTPLSFALHWAILKRHMLLYVFPLEAQTGQSAIFGQGFWHTGRLELHGPLFSTVMVTPLSFALHWAILKRHMLQYVFPLEAQTGQSAILGQGFWQSCSCFSPSPT